MAETKVTSEGTSETAAAPKKRRITKRKAVETHVRSYFEALAARDLSRAAGLWREDGVADVVPLGVLRGRDEITGMFRELFAAVPDLEISVTRLVAGEREAAVEWRMSGDFSGAPLQGVDATGRHVELRGLDLIEVEEAANVASTTYYDGMAFARQIGLMPARDSASERAMKSAFNAATRVRRAVAEHRAPG
jgi:steroid delta-isomerase-like uncharacterized protein